MVRDLSCWKGTALPTLVSIEGYYVRMEPVDLSHAVALYEESSAPGAEERFAFLFRPPPSELDEMVDWIKDAQTKKDPMMFALVDSKTGRAEGRFALMRLDPANGVGEIGHVMFGPGMARSRKATEAVYLATQYLFEGLGYRRVEWKCDSTNQPSRKAALRFGFTFEGIFRNHMVYNGRNRDTCWYGMTDDDYVNRVKPEFERWLDHKNFDSEGRQLSQLRIPPGANNQTSPF